MHLLKDETISKIGPVSNWNAQSQGEFNLSLFPVIAKVSSLSAKVGLQGSGLRPSVAQILPADGSSSVYWE